ncbi:MAG: hypothetical protein FJX74_09195 [Armatimonadetes bacterium]|nr:hypothetical protein [Armatimonadota bacterium]
MLRRPPLVLALVALSAALRAAPLTNVAGPLYGTRVVADTQYSDRHAGSKAVDGSLEPGAGCWYSRDQTPLPCALTFEFSAVEEVQQVNVVQAAWTASMYHTRQLAVEVSMDGTEWRRIAEGELPDESLARRELVFEPVAARWLRIVVLSSYNDFQTCGFAEVEVLAGGRPGFGEARITLIESPAPPPCSDVGGLSLIAGENGPQVAVIERLGMALVAARTGPEYAEPVTIQVPLSGVTGPATVRAQARLLAGSGATVTLATEGGASLTELRAGPVDLEAVCSLDRPVDSITLAVCPMEGEVLVQVDSLRLQVGDREFVVPLRLTTPDIGRGAPPLAPPLLPLMEQALIEWDWRLQDGIDTPRAPTTYADALQLTLSRGDALLRDLGLQNDAWTALKTAVGAASAATPSTLESLWRRAHQLKRSIALANPLADTGPLVFVKHVPPCFSHQLTQYYGRYARPGGGVFVLGRPGASMDVRDLTGAQLPPGSAMHAEVSYDGRRILFAFCEADTTPEDTIQGHPGRFYHLYATAADGSGLTQLTDGPHNDFAPKEMPDGRLLFISTRRGGWHRCGSPGCENYTLAVAEPDGSAPRPISFHETQEWDPAILNDGRIIYTRWDYVDRYAVLYQQLWTAFPDGSQPSIHYGNNTFNPVGIWEARPVPGSKRVMATAAAHHAMTAGSIILVDVAKGVDGLEPIIRLTPDAPFPESENDLAPHWRFHAAGIEPYEPIEQQRWPGHCYRSPYPLSETYFLAAYSFERLVGEPQGNRPNMFGLYLVDAFGNKELLYRDPNLSSVWPVPLRPRSKPPQPPSLLQPAAGPGEGLVLLQNLYDSAPSLRGESITRLRILQVLPKSTPGIDRPPVGLPRGAPGKQVLGTVPVEPDGSAYFRAPAGVPLSFQALDQRGMAVQVMRSETYLQPGETITCVGCHEPRSTAPPRQAIAALRRPPSTIEPGPEGSRPFSYPRLVQPVLDARCVSCHGDTDPGGGVKLTGAPEGQYSVSYNALAPRVPYSDQGLVDPLSTPNRFGARGSTLAKLLLDGHRDVTLSDEEFSRLVTWMDANALFYGTFDPDDQARQLRGELITGPKLQ